MRAGPSLYDKDFYAWATEQAALLRAGTWQKLDVANLIEEIEGLSSSQRRELANHFRILVAHLLKWRYQTARHTPSWRHSVVDRRLAIAELFEDSPSLRREAQAALARSYQRARLLATRQTRLPLATFPDICPWTAEQVLDEEFWPEE